MFDKYIRQFKKLVAFLIMLSAAGLAVRLYWYEPNGWDLILIVFCLIWGGIVAYQNI